LASLFAAAISLPAAITICCAFAWGLRGMADEGGASVLYRVALGLVVIWVLALVAMLLLLAWNQLAASDEPDNSHE
jgi:hypothetical protein